MAKHSLPFDMKKLLWHFGWDFPPENARRKKYPCVFCNDHRKHMSIDFVNDTFLCYRCGNHGGMLDLYRQVYGICKDNRETTELIKKQLGLCGSAAPPPLLFPAPVLGVEGADNPTTTRTDAELDRVYRALLGELPLSDAHKASLLARGLTAEDIRGDGYKSVPMGDYQEIARRLLNQGLELHGIPGFFTVKRTGRWSVFIPAEGFFVPVRNLSGQITGMAYYHIQLADWYDKTRKQGRNSSVRNSTGYAYLHISKLKALLTRNGGRIWTY